MSTGSTKLREEEKLHVPSETNVRQELSLSKAEEVQLQPGEDPELDQKAEETVEALINFDFSDEAAKSSSKTSIEQMGVQLQKQATKQSEMLKQPVSKLAERGDDGGEVAVALIDLKMQVESLDPARFDFDAGWFSRLLGYIPGFGSPMKRYFSKYESAQTVIDAIMKSLELGQEQLKRDNVTLVEDQKRMRELTHKLEKAIKLAQAIDGKIQYRLDREISANDPKHRFVQDELLFPLRQRIIDLQQQLAVNQQGVLATEIVIRNNKELIRGVDRAMSVTLNALQVAVTVALALENQKVVLDKVTALSQTTSGLIANTAERLKTQGAEIHKQASTSHLDMELLRQAFTDINAAIDDISEFRAKALPQMAKTIVEMNELTTEAEKKIEEKEQGNTRAPYIPIEIE